MAKKRLTKTEKQAIQTEIENLAVEQEILVIRQDRAFKLLKNLETAFPTFKEVSTESEVLFFKESIDSAKKEYEEVSKQARAMYDKIVALDEKL